MDRGGRDNVAKLVRGVRNGKVRRVFCMYETDEGTINYFRNNLLPAQAATLCEEMKRILVAEALR